MLILVTNNVPALKILLRRLRNVFEHTKFVLVVGLIVIVLVCVQTRHRVSLGWLRVLTLVRRRCRETFERSLPNHVPHHATQVSALSASGHQVSSYLWIHLYDAWPIRRSNRDVVRRRFQLDNNVLVFVFPVAVQFADVQDSRDLDLKRNVHALDAQRVMLPPDWVCLAESAFFWLKLREIGVLAEPNLLDDVFDTATHKERFSGCLWLTSESVGEEVQTVAREERNQFRMAYTTDTRGSFRHHRSRRLERQ